MTSSAKKYECVIWGGYAKGNTGDELCLAAALQRTQREFGPAVAILSPSPEFTSWLFPEAIVVPYVQFKKNKLKRWKSFLRKWRLFLSAPKPRELIFDPDCEWMRCLVDARRLHLAGGGYLTDLFPLDLALPPMEFARQLKLPVSTAPISIGPFKSSEWADRVAGVLSDVELKVREPVSYDFCRTRGLKAMQEPDDAVAFIENLLLATTEKKSGSRPPKIGVCIFTQYGQDAQLDLTGWWIELLRGLKLQHPEYQIEGFCFHTSLQAEFREMVRLFLRAGFSADQVLAPELDFRQATVALREYDFIISTRFHAVVAANVFKIPSLAIAAGDYYLAKMNAAVSGHKNFSQLISPTDITPKNVLAICKHELSRQTTHASH